MVGRAEIWDVGTGECTKTLGGHVYNCYAGWVMSVAFSPDDSAVLTAYWNGEPPDDTAKLWDVATGECTRTFSGHSKGLTGATFSADGASVLTTSADTTAKLWDVGTGECTRTFCGHSSRVISAIFSPDGSSVLTASGLKDQTAKLWDVATGECIKTFSGHQAPERHGLRGATFSADGASVLTASEDNTAKLWDVATGECTQTFSGHTDGPAGCSLVQIAVFGP